MLSSTERSAVGDGAQRRPRVVLVKERNDTGLDDPYETVSSPSTAAAFC